MCFPINGKCYVIGMYKQIIFKMNESEFPKKVFQEGLQVTKKIKGNMKPFIEEFSKQNLPWIFEAISMLFTNLSSNETPPVIKMNSMFAVKCILDSCQLIPVTLIETYILPIIVKGAEFSPNLEDEKRGADYFLREGGKQDNENIEGIGFNFVKLCTQILKVTAVIKPNTLYYNEQTRDSSDFMLSFKSVYKSLKYPPEALVFYKEQPEKLHSLFLANVAKFDETKSQMYSRYVSQIFTEQIKQGFKNQQHLDVRQLLKKGDYYIVEESLQICNEILSKGKSCSLIMHALKFINSMIEAGTFQVLLLLHGNANIGRLVQQVDNIKNDNKSLVRGENFLQEKKGTSNQKKQLYCQFLKYLQFWAQTYTKNSLSDAKKPTNVFKYYQYLKEVKNYEFPTNPFLEKQVKQSIANFERNHYRNQLAKSQLMEEVGDEQPDEIIMKLEKQENSKSTNKVESNKQLLRQEQKKVENFHTPTPQQSMDQRSGEALKMRLQKAEKVLNGLRSSEKNLHKSIDYLIIEKYAFENDLQVVELDDDELENCMSKYFDIVQLIQGIQPIYDQYKTSKIDYDQFCSKIVVNMSELRAAKDKKKSSKKLQSEKQLPKQGILLRQEPPIQNNPVKVEKGEKVEKSSKEIQKGEKSFKEIEKGEKVEKSSKEIEKAEKSSKEIQKGEKSSKEIEKGEKNSKEIEKVEKGEKSSKEIEKVEKGEKVEKSYKEIEKGEKSSKEIASVNKINQKEEGQKEIKIIKLQIPITVTHNAHNGHEQKVHFESSMLDRSEDDRSDHGRVGQQNHSKFKKKEDDFFQNLSIQISNLPQETEVDLDIEPAKKSFRKFNQHQNKEPLQPVANKLSKQSVPQVPKQIVPQPLSPKQSSKELPKQQNIPQMSNPRKSQQSSPKLLQQLRSNQVLPPPQPLFLEDDDEIIEGPELNPLENSYHDITEIEQSFKKNKTITFKQAINSNNFLMNGSKKQNLFWLKEQADSLIKPAVVNMKRSRVQSSFSIPSLLQQCNEKHEQQIKKIEENRDKKIRELQKQLSLAENEKSTISKQLRQKQYEIKSMREQSDYDRKSTSRVEQVNYVEDQNYVMKKLNAANSSHNKRRDFEKAKLYEGFNKSGKLINTTIYGEYFSGFSTEKQKKMHLKNKQLLFKDSQIEVGCMGHRERESYKITCFLTPEQDIQLIDIGVESDSNLKINHSTEQRIKIGKRKQQKLYFLIDVVNIPYKIPYVYLRYRLEEGNQSDRKVRIFLPCAFHKFFKIDDIDQKYLQDQLSLKEVQRGQEIPYSKRALKNIDDIQDYFPHIQKLYKGETNNQGQICYGGEATYKKTAFPIKISVKPNQFLYVQTVNPQGSAEQQKILQFYIATINYFLMKDISW